MTNRSGGHGGVSSLALNIILVLFVVGWVSSIGADIFRENYTAPTGLNETMIALVTALFVAQQRLPGKKQDPPPQATPSEGNPS